MRYIGVTEAAGILGISEHAVRQRAYRGSLPAKREAGRLLVSLDDQDTDVSHKTSHETRRDETPKTSETTDQVADLRAEILFLRRHIDHLTVLLQNEQRQIPATASPEALRDAVGAAEARVSIPPLDRSQGGAERGLRGWWKRIVGSE
jgi:hypothetical protein